MSIRNGKLGRTPVKHGSRKDKMKDILIVTGTCGVGKSTVCWEWAERRQGGRIYCDAFRAWIRNRALRTADGYQESLLAKHACALAEDYMALGLDVAIDNVWTPKGLALLHARLAHKSRLRVFWLSCSSEENHQRDKQRPPSAVMGGRLNELQAELEAMNWPEYVTRIDTTGQSLDQTIEVIAGSFQPPAPAIGGEFNEVEA